MRRLDQFDDKAAPFPHWPSAPVPPMAQQVYLSRGGGETGLIAATNGKERSCMPERQIGRSLTRFEAARFLRGAGRFVENIAVENALHGWVVRSPHGHAEILGTDIAAARALPGVLGV